VTDAALATAPQANSITVNSVSPTPTKITGNVRVTGSVVVR
jgi:hypothetical protein